MKKPFFLLTEKRKESSEKIKKEISLKDLMGCVPSKKKQRVRILFRDNFKCTNCGSKTKLNIHHMDGNRKNNHTSNLMTLCWDCHINFHTHGFF